MFHDPRRFLRHSGGATALEFALVAPVFFFLILGILEIALMLWFQYLLVEGSEQAGNYIRQQYHEGLSPSMTALRDRVCAFVSHGGLSCGTDVLKVAVYDASVPVNGGFGVPAILDNTGFPTSGEGKEYLIAVGYNWGIVLPTSRLLLPQGSDGSQLQGLSLAVAAERVWE